MFDPENANTLPTKQHQPKKQLIKQKFVTFKY